MLFVGIFIALRLNVLFIFIVIIVNREISVVFVGGWGGNLPAADENKS